ncbi:MAG: hypothetical protein OEM59_16205, partial [Rhodospirillales bacterium]|nr:hypothetical protein [Rhodospirillales bacterium]
MTPNERDPHVPGPMMAAFRVKPQALKDKARPAADVFYKQLTPGERGGKRKADPIRVLGSYLDPDPL